MECFVKCSAAGITVPHEHLIVVGRERNGTHELGGEWTEVLFLHPPRVNIGVVMLAFASQHSAIQERQGSQEACGYSSTSHGKLAKWSDSRKARKRVTEITVSVC
ncbi:hypothetical protein E2C01_010056 [Portunus trituberculatus]|uniref:Uncharacterized protein n=1 Tax=Portunus trituberculatus TaxID=210409 RepID=A0A5B7D7D0_PORTR|nr:hypothetical protein [Portunus trituberculatus]